MSSLEELEMLWEQSLVAHMFTLTALFFLFTQPPTQAIKGVHVNYELKISITQRNQGRSILLFQYKATSCSKRCLNSLDRHFKNTKAATILLASAQFATLLTIYMRIVGSVANQRTSFIIEP